MSGEANKTFDCASKRKTQKSEDKTDDKDDKAEHSNLTQGTSGQGSELQKKASPDAVMTTSTKGGGATTKKSNIEGSKKTSGIESKPMSKVTENKKPTMSAAVPRTITSPDDKTATKNLKSKKKPINAAELQQRMAGNKQLQDQGPKPVVIDTRNMNIFQKMLAERNQARQEESDYLKIRKQQLLRDLLPKSKAARLRRSDEKFPSAQLRAMEKWNFGAMKAKYMAIRPNGKYATWFGKKHDEKHKHEKCITIKDRILAARGSTAPQQETTKKINKSSKTLKMNKKKQAAEAQAAAQAALPLPPAQEETPLGAREEEQFDEEDFMTNVRYSRPFNDKGVLFWMDEQDNNVDTEDEETIVNLDSVVKDGELAQKMCNKYSQIRNSINVDMTNSMREMMKLDKMYEHKDVYLNTIVNVINLTPVGEKPEETKAPPSAKKVGWKADMVVAEYLSGADNIMGNKGVKTDTKPLKDVVKVAEKE